MIKETFAEEVERRRSERENEPEECSHCGVEGAPLKNYSRDYGGNVGGHWLCGFCDHTRSAHSQGAGGYPEEVTRDVAAMLNVLAAALGLFNKED
jgi:hypothetical protein